MTSDQLWRKIKHLSLLCTCKLSGLPWKAMKAVHCTLGRVTSAPWGHRAPAGVGEGAAGPFTVKRRLQRRGRGGRGQSKRALLTNHRPGLSRQDNPSDSVHLQIGNIIPGFPCLVMGLPLGD